MESADSQKTSYDRRSPAKRAAWRAGPVSLLFGIASGVHLVRSTADWRFVAALCLVLALWQIHMESAGVSHWIILPAIALFCAQFSTQAASFRDLAALAGGVFVYLLIWVLAEYDRQPALQGVATAALLLSGGVLAKPPIAIACVILSLAFFLVHFRSAAHPAGFGLLLFTPAVLCIAGGVVLAFLNAGSLHAQPAFTSPQGRAEAAGGDWRYLFLFPAAVIALRAIRRCLSSADLAFLAMCALGAVICRWQLLGGALKIEDLFFLSAGGAAALVSTMSRRPPGGREAAT
jgi:hypothetical protein